MAVEGSERRAALITTGIVVLLMTGAMIQYYPAIPRGILGMLVVLGALPIWAMVRGLDRLVFLSGRLDGVPSLVRVGMVVASSVTLVVVAVALVLVVFGAGQ